MKKCNFEMILKLNDMALQWKQLISDEPESGVDIWIRVYWYNGVPVEAQYSAVNQEFTTNELGIIFPAWAIARWAYPAGYSPSTNEPEVEQYISGLVTELSTVEITRLNTLVAGLKSDLTISALTEKFWLFYVLRGETEESSLKNLVQDLYHITKVNAPTWTQWLGFTGNGSNQTLDTGFNPSTQTDSGDTDSMSVFTEANNNATEDGYACLCDDGTNLTRIAYNRLSSMNGQINGTGANVLFATATTANGKLWCTRRGSSTQELILDSTVQNSGGASSTRPNKNLGFMGTVDGTLGSSGRYGFAGLGKGFTEGECDLIDARLDDYINSLP